MKAEVEEQTLRQIATYIEKREGFSAEMLFSMYDEGDRDGMLTETELIAGLQSCKINVNQQLKRILLSIFDHNKDGMISKDEFVNAVSKYSKKAPITTADVKGELFTEKDKEDIVKVVNEDRRTKNVFEDFAFDESDQAIMERRKAEQIELIKNNDMPKEPMLGEF